MPSLSSPVRPLTLAVCAALAALSAVSAFADEARLGEVLVSSGRDSAAPVNLPASQAGMSAAQLAAAVNVINTEDVVKYLPSVQVRKRYIGDRNSIIATRTSGQTSSARSLVYADGVLLSNLLGNRYDFPPRWNMVSADEISRVDMVYGPFAAEFPGNSVGSVVLLNTRAPDKFEAHVKAQAFREDFSLYNSQQHYDGNKLEAGLGGRVGALAWQLDASHLDSHGHPMSFAANPSRYTGSAAATAVSGALRDTDPYGASRLLLGATSVDHTTQDSARAKLTWDITPTLRASYQLGYWQNRSDSTVDSYLRNAAGEAVYSGIVSIDGQKYTLGTLFAPSQRQEAHLSNALTLASHTGGEWDWQAVASDYRYLKDNSRAPSVAIANPRQGGAGRITLMDGTGWQTFDLKADWRPGGSRASEHQLRFGYHYDRYTLDSRTYATNDWLSGVQGAQTDAFAGHTSTHALFVQDTWRFLPDWRLTPGLRYERWQAWGGRTLTAGKTFNHAERDNNYWSPKLALSHDLNPDLTLRAAWGRAWRMPTVSELFQGSAAGSNSIVNNDPTLRPERGDTLELAAEYALGANGQLRLSAFQESLRDALLSQTNTTVNPNITNIQNIDRVRTRGLELAAKASDVGLRGLDLSGSLTWAHSRVLANSKNPTSEGNAYPGIPTWRATLLATWRQNEALSYSLGARYSGKQAYDINNTATYDASQYGVNSRYLLVDARVQYKLNKQFTVSAGVDNLNNDKSFAYHPMPQRTWHAEVKFDY